jgi:hypothetical protein
MKPEFFNLLVIFLVLLVLNIQAQTNEKDTRAFSRGSWELNLSGDFGTQSSETVVNGKSYGSSEANFYGQLHIIPGIYIVDGLSFEPEVDFLFIKDVDPSYSFIPNISYTHRFPSNSNVAFYARAGYGISNSYNLFGLLLQTSKSANVGILNLGVGLKYLISESFCFRTEINYRRTSYTNEETYYFYYSKTEETLTNIRVLLGFSLIL